LVCSQEFVVKRVARQFVGVGCVCVYCQLHYMCCLQQAQQQQQERQERDLQKCQAR